MKPAKSTSRPTPPDLTVTPPRRAGAVDTFNVILDSASALLGEVGFERLSTNMVCRHAGLTPPALYRYFPNKYAVLNALAQRLMDRQNDVYVAWLERNGTRKPDDSRETAVRDLAAMQKEVNAVTRASAGAIWIMRAMRAVPALQEVRLESHGFVTEKSVDHMQAVYPEVSRAMLTIASRLSTEVMYAATEMVMDDPSLDEDLINHEVSDMVVRYFEKLTHPEEAPAPAAKRPRR